MPPALHQGPPPAETALGHYILYTHWGVGNRPEDISDWQINNESPDWLQRQPVYRYLADARPHLTALLEKTDGLLILFFDPGWKLALKPSLSGPEQAELDRAERYSLAVWHCLAGAFDASRVRILTVRALQDFIRELRERARPEIYRWFVGEKGEGAYDSPKVIEAFLRVRRIGSGIPVLRVDWDVLINVENRRFESLGVTQEAIEASLSHDDQERKVLTRTWVCSAGYQRPNARTYDAWSRGFATRIQPALRATSEMCQLVCGKNFGLLETPLPADSGLRVDDITQESFDYELTKRYLGVEQRSDDGSWDETPEEGSIAKLGAHPLHAVISGALLNLSASAILDLPPFSNMMRPVMWIDDHLKFELHKALGHLRPDAFGTCRLEITVVKGRAAPEPNLAAYTWASYLPTLLLGLVMDAWIRKESKEESDERPFVKELRRAITTGTFDHRTAMKLERRLGEVAIERIRKVHRAWSALKDGDTHTLASAWATSQVETLVKARCKSDSRGLGLIASGSEEIRDISDLRPPIQEDLRELIWDAVDYIQLTIRWPGMIQTIRAVERSLAPVS